MNSSSEGILPKDGDGAPRALGFEPQSASSLDVARLRPSPGLSARSRRPAGARTTPGEVTSRNRGKRRGGRHPRCHGVPGGAASPVSPAAPRSSPDKAEVPWRLSSASAPGDSEARRGTLSFSWPRPKRLAGPRQLPRLAKE